MVMKVALQTNMYSTKHCGFLNHLNPSVLYYWTEGLSIEDSVIFRGATLDIPCVTRGKTQLMQEVELKRKQANVRIHVECIMGGTCQTYSILCATTVLP